MLFQLEMNYWTNAHASVCSENIILTYQVIRTMRSSQALLSSNPAKFFPKRSAVQILGGKFAPDNLVKQKLHTLLVLHKVVNLGLEEDLVVWFVQNLNCKSEAGLWLVARLFSSIELDCNQMQIPSWEVFIGWQSLARSHQSIRQKRESLLSWKNWHHCHLIGGGAQIGEDCTFVKGPLAKERIIHQRSQSSPIWSHYLSLFSDQTLIIFLFNAFLAFGWGKVGLYFMCESPSAKMIPSTWFKVWKVLFFSFKTNLHFLVGFTRLESGSGRGGCIKNKSSLIYDRNCFLPKLVRNLYIILVCLLLFIVDLLSSVALLCTVFLVQR